MESEDLYDRSASRWQRRAPNSLSDFTGRPAVFELCGDVRGLRVLDVGCGEGYCTRELKSRGSAHTVGLELSGEMIRLAREQEETLAQGIDYRSGDVRELPFEDASFDLVTAVFVFNYLDAQGCGAALREIHRVLCPDGQLVFSIPHPCFPFMRAAAAPFFFDFGSRGYFSGSDSRNAGEIHCLDGTVLPVQMVHKPIEVFFRALSEAGFTSLPELRELRVLPEHVEIAPDFFGPLVDVPLHMALRVRR